MVFIFNVWIAFSVCIAVNKFKAFLYFRIVQAGACGLSTLPALLAVVVAYNAGIELALTEYLVLKDAEVQPANTSSVTLR